MCVRVCTQCVCLLFWLLAQENLAGLYTLISTRIRTSSLHLQCVSFIYTHCMHRIYTAHSTYATYLCRSSTPTYRALIIEIVRVCFRRFCANAQNISQSANARAMRSLFGVCFRMQLRAHFYVHTRSELARKLHINKKIYKIYNRASAHGVY